MITYLINNVLCIDIIAYFYWVEISENLLDVCGCCCCCCCCWWYAAAAAAAAAMAMPVVDVPGEGDDEDVDEVSNNIF